VDPLGLEKQAEEKWYEKAWQKTKDAATVTGAFVEGAATGLKDAVVGVGKTVVEGGAIVADTANRAVQTASLLTTGTETSLYEGNASQSGDALNSGSGEAAGDYYVNTAANIATVGLVDSGKAVIERSYGLIDDKEFSERVGGNGILQLVAAKGMKKRQAAKSKMQVSKTKADAPKVKSGGRSGKQARIKAIADDPKASSADRGWVRNEKRRIKFGNGSKN
jgi:hypothetical protein